MSLVSLTLALALALPVRAATVEDGIAAFQQGRYKAAAATLKDALSRNPRDEHARTFLALAETAMGRCADVLPDLRAAWEKSSQPDLRRLAGLALVDCHSSRNELDAALPVLAQLRAAYPADADVLFEAARIHMKAFNDATYDMFRKAPASYRVNQLSAEIFETQGRYTDAISEYRKALAKNPKALGLHFRLGRAMLLDSHDPEALARARSEFEAELALNAEDCAAEFQIGQILTAQSKPADARPHFERALNLKPDFAEAALAVAKMDVQEKRYAPAIPLLEQVVAAQPRNEVARYNLMIAYRNAGMTDKARAQQQELNRLQQPPEGEFNDFLKRLGEKPPAQ